MTRDQEDKGTIQGALQVFWVVSLRWVVHAHHVHGSVTHAETRWFRSFHVIEHDSLAGVPWSRHVRSWMELVWRITIAFGTCFYAEFLPLWLFNNTTAIEKVRALAIGAAVGLQSAENVHGQCFSPGSNNCEVLVLSYIQLQIWITQLQIWKAVAPTTFLTQNMFKVCLQPCLVYCAHSLKRKLWCCIYAHRQCYVVPD